MPPAELHQEQLTLFELGADMKRLRAEREALAGHRRAPATKRALESDWRHFDAWCRDAGRLPVPATAETVELYLTHCVSEGLRVSTLHRRVWAIGRQHQQMGEASPIGDGARELLASAARAKGTRTRQKAAITPEQLRRMVAGLDARTERGARDRAVLLLGFSTGLRRSELAGLQLDQVAIDDGRGLMVNLGKSKTDQEGEGRVIGVSKGVRELDPVAAINRWLRFRGPAPGSLFGVTDRTIYQAVRDAAERTGLDPRQVGAHSLRAGMITEMDRQGVSLPSIMKRSGHRSVATVVRYVRNRDPYAHDPLAKIG
jgi:site-specific recombinase XerD